MQPRNYYRQSIRLSLTALDYPCYNSSMSTQTHDHPKPYSKNPPPLTDKQERFAQLIVAGCSQSEAYRRAYDTTSDNIETIARNAHTLAVETTKVAARIDELKSQIRTKITPELISEKMLLTYTAASGAEQHSAAVKAMDLAAKVAGLYHDQPASSHTLIQVVQTFRGISTEELRAMLQDAQDARSGTTLALEAPVVEGEYLDMGEPTTDDEGEAP